MWALVCMYTMGLLNTSLKVAKVLRPGRKMLFWVVLIRAVHTGIILVCKVEWSNSTFLSFKFYL